MEASTLRKSEYEDEERRVLEGLIDAFSSTFSLREIASAFCKAGRNPDLAAGLLYDSQGCTSNAPTTYRSESETRGASSSGSLSESVCVANKSNLVEKNCKASKSKKHSVSMGTVSGVIGKGYVKPPTPANEACRTTKPLKLDLKDLPMASGDVSSDSAVKNDHLHKGIEDFLIKMLGDGFQLDKDVIREVLGFCGYDAKKSMDQLMNISASTFKNSKDIVAGSTRKFADEYPKTKSSLSQENSAHMDLPQRDKERDDLQREVLSSLFGVPERLEEVPKRNRPIRAVKTRPGRVVVFEPPRDDVEHSNGPVEPHHDSEDEEEEDSYQVLRRVTMEHWVTTKEYFKSAYDAFANGDRTLSDELLKQGHYFNQKAREADAKSSQFNLQGRKGNQDVLTVDLQDHGTKEAIRTLKFYLTTLAGMPSQFLKLIIGDAKDTKKNSRRTRVLELLDRESIKWTEEGNPETIMIELDDINPKDLSFYGERSRNDE